MASPFSFGAGTLAENPAQVQRYEIPRNHAIFVRHLSATLLTFGTDCYSFPDGMGLPGPPRREKNEDGCLPTTVLRNSNLKLNL